MLLFSGFNSWHYQGLKLKFLVFLAILINPLQTFSQDTLIIGTGSTVGTYYGVGKKIAQVVRDSFPEICIKSIQTRASVHNIRLLDQDSIDFAIVQNDVAYYAENAVNAFGDERPYKNIRGVYPLFREPIYFISHIKGLTFNDIDKYIINVGEEGSGIAQNAETILDPGKTELFQNLDIRHLHPNGARDSLLSKQFDITIANTLNACQQDIKDGTLYLIEIPESYIERLRKKYGYTYFSLFEDSTFRTISVEAILICKSSVPNKVVEKVTMAIHNSIESMNLPNRFSQELVDKYKIPLNKWHRGSKRFLIKEDKITTDSMIKMTWGVLFTILIILVLFLLLNFYYVKLQKRFPLVFNNSTKFGRIVIGINTQYLRFKYLIIAYLLLMTFVSNLLVVKNFESKWANKNNTSSFFEDEPFYKSVIWLFVFGASGYEQDRFPQSQGGKIFVALIPLIGLGGGLAIVGLLTSDHIKKRMMETKGTRSRKFKNHIILCGWNDNVPFIIQSLMHKNLVTTRKPITLLCDCPDDSFISTKITGNKELSYVRGDAKNRKDLELAGLQHAEIAIIVSEPNNNQSNPDSETILRVLAIEENCLKLESEGKRDLKNIYTIAEIHSPENRDLAKLAKVDEIVSMENITSKILTTSINNPGVSKMINEILTFDDYNELYNIHISNNDRFAHKTFDELLPELRKFNVLLMAINVENHRVEQDANHIKKENNLKRGILTNPIFKEEIEYRVSEGDVLIVLAKDQNALRLAEKG